jgi:anaphase-promoting complex subunit 1
MDHLIEDKILQMRFSQDHRITEVRRLLQSAKPCRITLQQKPEVSDHEFIEHQEKWLLLVCQRTMALPVARLRYFGRIYKFLKLPCLAEACSHWVP